MPIDDTTGEQKKWMSLSEASIYRPGTNDSTQCVLYQEEM